MMTNSLHNLLLRSLPAGIYSNSYDAALNVKNGFPVFSTVIEANNVSNTKSGFLAYNLTDEDVAELRQLGGQPDIGRLCEACNLVSCHIPKSACLDSACNETPSNHQSSSISYSITKRRGSEQVER